MLYSLFIRLFVRLGVDDGWGHTLGMFRLDWHHTDHGCRMHETVGLMFRGKYHEIYDRVTFSIDGVEDLMEIIHSLSTQLVQSDKQAHNAYVSGHEAGQQFVLRGDDIVEGQFVDGNEIAHEYRV